MVSKVENGRALPSLTTLHRIYRVLNLTVGQLFDKATSRQACSRALANGRS